MSQLSHLSIFALLLVASHGGSATTEEKSSGATTSLLLDRGALDEFDNMAFLPVKEGKAARLVMGDDHGFLHVYEQRGEAFGEEWTSEFFEGAISHLFIVDVNADALQEIVVVTDQGRFYYLDATAYNTLWSSPPSDYQRITALSIHNIDEDEQPELIFCADGHLIIYDGRDRFEEWRSEQDNLSSSEILVGDVDGDGTDEIVLNDGYIFDARYHDLEWQSPDSFGQRMGLLDIDDDGILEVIGEFRDRFIRIFDIDLRREKSPRN